MPFFGPAKPEPKYPRLKFALVVEWAPPLADVLLGEQVRKRGAPGSTVECAGSIVKIAAARAKALDAAPAKHVAGSCRQKGLTMAQGAGAPPKVARGVFSSHRFHAAGCQYKASVDEPI